MTEDLIDPHSLTEKELGWVIDQLKILRSWANSIENEALTRLMEGREVPGYKLVESRRNRAWNNKEQAAEILLLKGFETEDIFPPGFVSPAQAEKLFKKSGKMDEWGDIIECISRERGRPTLAPIDDPRHEYVRGEEFKDEPDE